MTMTSSSFKISKKQIPSFLLLAYPDYRGRKFSVTITNRVYMHDYWDEGSRTYLIAANLDTQEIFSPSTKINNPFNPDAHKVLDIPENVCIIEHVIFCGKDLGLRFNINPVNAPLFLTS